MNFVHLYHFLTIQSTLFMLIDDFVLFQSHVLSKAHNQASSDHSLGLVFHFSLIHITIELLPLLCSTVMPTPCNTVTPRPCSTLILQPCSTVIVVHIQCRKELSKEATMRTLDNQFPAAYCCTLVQMHQDLAPPLGSTIISELRYVQLPYAPGSLGG
jgi:hypothetical protein